MHVLVGGGSGFIWKAFMDASKAIGDMVTRISRTDGPGRITWARVSSEELPDCDAVVNLAGAHVLDPRRRRTAGYRGDVIASRVETTTTWWTPSTQMRSRRPA